MCSIGGEWDHEKFDSKNLCSHFVIWKLGIKILQTYCKGDVTATPRISWLVYFTNIEPWIYLSMIKLGASNNQDIIHKLQQKLRSAWIEILCTFVI